MKADILEDLWPHSISQADILETYHRCASLNCPHSDWATDEIDIKMTFNPHG